MTLLSHCSIRKIWLKIWDQDNYLLATLINNVSKWPPMKFIMMFYTFDGIKTIEGNCVATKYKYSTKCDVKLVSGEKSKQRTTTSFTVYNFGKNSKSGKFLKKLTNNSSDLLYDLFFHV